MFYIVPKKDAIKDIIFEGDLYHSYINSPYLHSHKWDSCFLGRLAPSPYLPYHVDAIELGFENIAPFFNGMF